jgi:predicted TIM-barrel fold metal-dependent hydrolase
MRIVDSQVHLWRDGLPPAPQHRQVESYWAEDLLAEMETAGVDAVVLCPPQFYPAGNHTYDEVIARYPERFASWGFFPVDSPDREAIMRTWRRPPYMLGVRYTFILPTTIPFWTNGAMDWLWPAAEKAGVPLGFYAYGRLDIIAEKAARHPNLKICIDSMARQALKTGAEALTDLPQLLTLAKYPNVAVKLSGLPEASAEVYPFRDLHDPIHRCIDAFGPERCFWGTDLTRMPCSYRQCVTMFTEEMPWLHGEDLRLVMGEGVMRWLDWRPLGWSA